MRGSLSVLAVALLVVAAQAHELDDGLPPSVVAPGTASIALVQHMRDLHVPGVSIAYVHDGRIAWTGAFGVRSTNGPATTPDTRFQAASLSKAVTAFGVLREVQAGRLDLDADVRGYLKRWRIPENDFTRGHKITLRQLLSHTAGMSVHGFAGYAADAPLPDIVQVLNGDGPANSPPIVAAAGPGSRCSYSGGGYVIAQLVLEDVTGLSFSALMQRDVLAPLNMTRSSFQAAPPEGDVATPYRAWDMPVRGGPHRYPELAPAGLWSTPRDLARLLIAIQASLKGTPGAPLSRELAQVMTSQIAPPSQLGLATDGVPSGYGLGLVTAEGDHPFFWHDGEDEGFLSLMLAFRNGDGLVVMSNGERGDILSADILRAFAQAHDWPNFQPQRVAGGAVPGAAYAGHYRANDGVTFVVTAGADGLHERHVGSFATKLLLLDPPTAGGGQMFMASGWNGSDAVQRLTFTPGPDGRADKLVVSEDDHARTAARIADDDPIALRIDALLRRIDNQNEGAGTHPALETVIQALAQGSLAGVKAEPSWAKDMEGNLAFYLRDAKRMGALRQITFRGVGPGGNDIFEVEYAHGWAIWRIGLSAAGKVRTAYYSAD